ncbi:hypothetical protein GNP80_03600 [Aliivibrio fischeri]|uniref:hypothetical protein n=1 Tax=Aliivibrio fischeri TaxID=668 RepID=UPI0012D95F14|nr:hypothetical protein [Aliivibrio fischeri]MUK91535.1 hypothetical protein [Aliivibrio fischeri]
MPEEQFYDARYDIASEITEETVKLAISGLNTASKDEKILIHLPYNNGGETDAAIELIEAVKATDATVTIEADRYVISAAAFIFVWFIVYPEDHVSVDTTDEIGPIIIYHRPRYVMDDDRIEFLSDITPQTLGWDDLNFITDKFDAVFDELLGLLGYDPSIHQVDAGARFSLEHDKNAYYSNYDVAIPY